MIARVRCIKDFLGIKGDGWANLASLVALLALVLLPSITSAAAQEERTQVNLVVGEIQTLALPVDKKIIRIGIGNGKLFEAKILTEGGSKILFVPEIAGRTNMLVWTSDGESNEYAVKVSAMNIEVVIASINDMLKGIRNVKVERAGDSIVVSGSTSKLHMPRISAISKSYPLVIIAVRDEELEMKRMVYMRVQIVEMKRSLVENLGVQWDKSIAGPAIGVVTNFLGGSDFRPGGVPAGLPEAKDLPVRGYGFKPAIALTSIITAAINLAVNNGDAYILATPELSTRSGGKAEFLAGGQIPVVSPASGMTAATVTFKDYGIKLTMEPRADEMDNVSTSLSTEISNIDTSVSVSGNPGFLTRKTSSEFNVQAGQTIMISGLMNADVAKDISKLAGLGDIPVLGALFRSTNFRAGRTDMVILVTPTVIDPSPDAVKRASGIADRAQGIADEKGLILK